MSQPLTITAKGTLANTTYADFLGLLAKDRESTRHGVLRLFLRGVPMFTISGDCLPKELFLPCEFDSWEWWGPGVVTAIKTNRGNFQRRVDS